MVSGPKPDIDNPADLSDRPLTTVIAYTFPSDIQGGWVVPLKVAAYEDIQPPESDGFTEVGIVVLGINLSEISPLASLNSTVSWSGPAGAGFGIQGRVENVGLVIAYTPGESITIVGRDGELETFTLASPLRIVPANRAGLLGPGAFVTVQAPSNDPNNRQTAVGIVIHPDRPRNFPDQIEISVEVMINVTSTDDDVDVVLVREDGETIDTIFTRIPQIVNPERTGLYYPEFGNLGPVPSSAATIAADGVCFVINDAAVVPSGPMRYCSTVEPEITLAFRAPVNQAVPFFGRTSHSLNSPFAVALDLDSASQLSVKDSYPTQYADLQSRIVAAADHISYESPLDLGEILSTIEDPQRIQDCANAGKNKEDQRAACSSDIILAPVTKEYFEEQYDNLLALPLPLAAPTTIDVGVVRVLQTINLPTEAPVGSVTILPGDYRLDYWFDVNGVFYASTLTGLTTADTPVTNQQAPAIPAAFLDADPDGPGQPFAQITACRISRWCIFERGCD
jgi:hypothetical protein